MRCEVCRKRKALVGSKSEKYGERDPGERRHHEHREPFRNAEPHKGGDTHGSRQPRDDACPGCGFDEWSHRQADYPTSRGASQDTAAQIRVKRLRVRVQCPLRNRTRVLRASSPRGSDRTAPLAEWLEWAERYIEMSDPLARFRDRKEVVKLYVSGYGSEVARMRTQGFEDPDPPTFQPEKAPPPGIRLQDAKPDRDWLTEAWELEVREDVVLPYEVTKPGYVPRTFYVPARVLNEAVGKAKTESQTKGWPICPR